MKKENQKIKPHGSDQLNIVGREEAAVAVAGAAPPALVDLLNVLDDVVRVEPDLVLAGCDVWNVCVRVYVRLE